MDCTNYEHCKTRSHSDIANQTAPIKTLVSDAQGRVTALDKVFSEKIGDLSKEVKNIHSKLDKIDIEKLSSTVEELNIFLNGKLNTRGFVARYDNLENQFNGFVSEYKEKLKAEEIEKNKMKWEWIKIKIAIALYIFTSVLGTVFICVKHKFGL
jgi:hypothetical protein